MRWAVPVLVGIVVVALPAHAAADLRFRGKTGQGRLVTLRTDDAGMVEMVDIGWRSRCQPGGWSQGATKFLPRFDLLTRDRIVDAGSYRERLEGGIRSILNARVAGSRVSERRWRGVFRIRERVFRGGRLVMTCYRRTGWKVVRRAP
jgi:hypothetical protein